MIKDTRRRTLELVSGLDEKQLIGPKLPTINPLLWEIGCRTLRESDVDVVTLRAGAASAGGVAAAHHPLAG